MPAIHQLVAGFTQGDAITNEARLLRDRFVGWGFSSKIFAERASIHPDLRGEALDAETAPDAVASTDTVLLHLSIGSPVNDLFARLRCRKALLYHNITPHAYFSVLRPRTAERLRQGRRQLAGLVGTAEVNMAVSRFNAGEMEAVGYRDVHIVPLSVNLAALDQAPDGTMMERLHDGRTNVLFVGRCAPNKRIDDLVRAFCCFREAVDPHARLVLAGSAEGQNTYLRIVRAVARDLGVSDNVYTTGGITNQELAACYRSADLFLCMSEHEGFCAPLIESMHFNVPILAFAAGAVPETLDGAGVLFHRKDFPAVAEMMGLLTRDQALREAVQRGQQERLVRFRGRDGANALRGLLSS
jgi:glycosyltransferase involved in cell wall biosynthesis